MADELDPGIWWIGSSLIDLALNPSLADELVGGETIQGLEATAEVEGVYKVGEVTSKVRRSGREVAGLSSSENQMTSIHKQNLT